MVLAKFLSSVEISEKPVLGRRAVAHRRASRESSPLLVRGRGCQPRRESRVSSGAFQFALYQRSGRSNLWVHRQQSNRTWAPDYAVGAMMPLHMVSYASSTAPDRGALQPPKIGATPDDTKGVRRDARVALLRRTTRYVLGAWLALAWGVFGTGVV
jgi:hypothetical protein